MSDDATNEGRAAQADASVPSEVERRAASSAQALEAAASRYGSWARAVQADRTIADQLALFAGQAVVDQGRQKKAIAEISELMPNVRANLDELTAKVSTQLWTALAPEAEQRVRDALDGLAALVPRYDKALQEASAAHLGNLLDKMMPDLVGIQRSLNLLNKPTATRETQEFITGTDNLRFLGNRRVWHYTSAHALDQILRHHVLWASNPHHLNDASELIHGVEIARAAIDRAEPLEGGTLDVLHEVTAEGFISDAMHEIYFISASTASDSLTLWRNYSTSDGFAIGLQPRRPLAPEGLILKDSEADEETGLPSVANWYRVHYRPAEKNRLADAFVASAIRDIRAADPADRELVITELRKHLLILASTLKHEAFRDEREVRWIATNWTPFNVLHFEITGRGFVPVLHARSAGFSEADPYLPISGVRCSPTTSPMIERTMRGLLSQRGYSVAASDVQKSTLPFRG